MSGVHVSDDPVVLVEVGCLPDAGGAVEGSIYNAVRVFVGVKERRLPTHCLSVEELGGLLAGVEDLRQARVHGAKLEHVHRVRCHVSGQARQPASYLKSGLTHGLVIACRIPRAHYCVVFLNIRLVVWAGFDLKDKIGRAGEGGVVGAQAEHVNNGLPPVDRLSPHCLSCGGHCHPFQTMSPALAHGERWAQDAGKHLTGPRHLVPRLDNVQSVENADLVSGVYGVDLNVFEEVFGEHEVFDGARIDT